VGLPGREGPGNPANMKGATTMNCENVHQAPGARVNTGRLT
jgi:hypothetical protein